MHTDLDQLINPTAKIEVLAEGFTWVEGPLWISKWQSLLFSDIPNNTVYRWSKKNGLETYLKPAGYTGKLTRGGELGSNGLLLDVKDQLILCQHGDRRIARMDAPLHAPKPEFTSLADQYQRKKFNSPNDIIQRSNGDLIFTDPPYGLNNQQISKQELSFYGVYKLDTLGHVVLLIDSLHRPNGLALTPDEKQLIVGNSDGDKPMLYAYDILPKGTLKAAGIVFDFSQYHGAPDGFKIDRQGNLFVSGPGGIWILNKSYQAIGRIKIPHAVSNCCLADDDKTLYITANHQLLRVKMR
ncbi:SMP-30/gluconolactonase/LRE family protein [Olivibacter ginsenosidimutans]|uniref:SMP-30/gluconolactonase/LRE family protein n=2 Tax=Olivibacter ginsenosidimutans TaxID=1176537 RepID=A0ABP9C4H7_9SPHI